MASATNQLFIPTKIKVGYQKRDDTYTKRLAYITYYDQKGTLRKEGSWEGWRDKKIEPEEFENKPHSGFVLNKDVRRYGYFGSGRNMIRIYDDRGIEFEITTANLLFILMTTNCHKRGLEGEFVYAWNRNELILLPVDCEEYKESAQFTDLQAQKISAKDLVPGCSYKTKKQKDLIYLGRFKWLQRSYRRNSESLKSSKRYVFVNESGEYVALSDVDSLAVQNSDIPVSNFAELAEKYSKSPRSFKAVALKSKPSKSDTKFYTEENGKFHEWEKQVYTPWNAKEPVTTYNGYYAVSMADGVVARSYSGRTYGYNTKQPEPQGDRLELFVVLENDEVVKLDKYFQMIN